MEAFRPFVIMNYETSITAELISEVCHIMYSLGIEPHLQPVSDERLLHHTANREDGAWPDIAADSFWGNDRQHAFFDIRLGFLILLHQAIRIPLRLSVIAEMKWKRNVLMTNVSEKLTMGPSHHLFSVPLGASGKWLQ